MEWITTSTILTDLADFTNRQAWERFVHRFRDPIGRFGRQMGLSEADAEEAAQDTLLAFAESFRNGQYDRAKGRLSRWLFGIAYRQLLARRRSAFRRRSVALQTEESGFLDQIPGEADAQQWWEQEWEQAMLELCLHRVRQEVEPPTMRAFELVMRGGRTPAEAAKELGIPTKAVYNAKFRVLKRLRALRREIEETL